jgi:hypothetical protein
MVIAHRPMPRKEHPVKRRTTLKYALTAALLAGTVASTPAFARPIDRVDRYDSVQTSSLAGTTEKMFKPKQDYRSADALDSALNQEFMPNQPTWPAHPAPATKPVSAPAPATGTVDGDGDGDGIWIVLGLGLAGAGIAAGAAAVTRRTRVRARRVAA